MKCLIDNVIWLVNVSNVSMCPGDPTSASVVTAITRPPVHHNMF